MSTKILCKGIEDALEVKESYATIRNRLFRNDAFFEVSTEQHRLILAKGQIMRVYPVTHKEKTTVTVKK